MKFGMSVNMNIPDGPRIAKMALDLLDGHEVLLEKEAADRFKVKGYDIDDMDVDMMVTVGGDGTILRALQHNHAPVFSINAGDLGFLTVVSEEELEEGIESLLNGDYELEERTKLQTSVGGKRMFDAVNETVVHTAHVAKIRHFQVFVDGEMAVNVRADGIDHRLRPAVPHKLLRPVETGVEDAHDETATLLQMLGHVPQRRLLLLPFQQMQESVERYHHQTVAAGALERTHVRMVHAHPLLHVIVSLLHLRRQAVEHAVTAIDRV